MNKWNFGLQTIWQTPESIVPFTMGLIAMVLIIAGLSGGNALIMRIGWWSLFGTTANAAR